MGKGLLVTGLGMPESNPALRLMMHIVEARFRRCGLPMETFWSEWEGRETLDKKYQRVTDKIATFSSIGKPNSQELVVPMVGISMGFQLALPAAVEMGRSINGIVGVVPVARGRGANGGQFDSQFDKLESWGSKSCAESVRNIERYINPEVLSTIRSMAVIGNDELVFEGMSLLPGAIITPWNEAIRSTPKDSLSTVRSPYHKHAMIGAFLMIFNTRMLVDRLKQSGG